LQESACLARDTGRHQHAQVAHGQRDMVRRARKLRLADADSAVTVFLESGENLPDSDRVCACNDSQRPIGMPAALARPEKLISHRLAHQGRHQSEVTRLHGGPALDRGSPQEDHVTGRLLRVALQEPVDHQSSQAVPDKMQPLCIELAHELLQPGGNLVHGRSGGGIPERVHIKSEFTGESTSQQQRLAPRQPQPVNVNHLFRHTAREPWACRKPCSRTDISKKWRSGACARLTALRAPAALAALLLITAALFFVPTGARAADPQPYKVDMASAGDSDLNSTLKATSELITLRTSAPVGPFGLIGRARGDLERLKTVLESDGFYQSYVAITIDGLPLDDPGLGEELTARAKSDDSRVKITFSLGSLYHVRKVEIDGDIPESAKKALNLKEGATAIAADILAAGDRLQNALEDEGYAFAKVDPPIAREDPQNRVLDLSFHAVTGARIQIGEIRIRGLKKMKETYVRKRLLVHTGEQYGATKIETARKDLLAMGVFSSVSVRLGKKADDEGRIPVTFQIRERLLHAMSISGAYSSDLGGSTGVTWTNRDFSGKADSLAISASALNLGGGTAANGIGYDTSAKYTLPGFLRRDQSLQFTVEALSQSLTAYDQKAFTAAVTLNRKLSSIWSISAGFSIEEERILQQECNAQQNCVPDPQNLECVQLAGSSGSCTFQTFTYTLVALPLSIQLNTTGLASPLEDASKGMRISLGVTPTFSIGHPSTRFFVTQATASLYVDLHNLHLNNDPGRSVLALRALGGLAVGANEFSLPPDQRFYAGGSGTIRGYAYQSVGPTFPDSNPIGGTAINAGTAEYRQRIGTNFGTAVFLDGGNVSRNLDPFNGQLRFGAGAGVRYYTPIGPIRLDIAVPIHKRPSTITKTEYIPGDDSFEVYIGLGQAF
jgi:translocation and assembly module TamA